MAEVLISSLEATNELAYAIADCIDGGLVIALSGNLGAGKTTFVKALAQRLDVSEVVSSPTFTTMNEYRSGRVPLFHIDLYRVGENIDKNKNREVETSLDYFVMEFEEILETQSVIVIEWPEFFLVDGELYLDKVDRLSLNIKIPPTDKENEIDEFCRIIEFVANGNVSKIVEESLFVKLGNSQGIKLSR